MSSVTEWNTGHLLITGREYIEFIHKIPVTERRWYHHAYLWYYTHAKVILMALAICAVIYAALMYRGLFTGAAAASTKTRRVMTGGATNNNEMLLEFGEFGGENSNTLKKLNSLQKAKQAKSSTPKPESKPFEYKASGFEWNASPKPTASSGGSSAGGSASTTPSKPSDPKPVVGQSQLPSETDKEQRDAKLQEERVKAAVKKAEKGDRFNYMTKGASKRLQGVADKVKGAPGAVKEKYKSLKADFKSGKMKAQAKLMTQAAGAKIHDTVAQNAGSVYTIIFSVFLISGIGLYFVPTLAMIGIGILTFYMFSDFLRGVITL